MSVLCSFYVHNVAVSGEAVNSNFINGTLNFLNVLWFPLLFPLLFSKMYYSIKILNTIPN